MPSSNLLIYGSNGYTGTLIARAAIAQGLRPILAGRNQELVAQLAGELGLDYQSFALDDSSSVKAALSSAAAVLNCAGPFSRTFKPMVEGCLQTRTHYLDVSGEISVLEALASYDQKAKSAGIMVLPAVGFDVVPSDCLAAHLKTRLPSAERLTLGLSSTSGMSRGTATTVVENIHRGGMVRRDGSLTPVRAIWKTRMIDFGKGPVSAVLVPWADVSTAYFSTGIPNIEVYATVTPSQRRMMVLSRYTGWILGTTTVQGFLKGRIRAQSIGPTDEERANAKGVVWAEVEDKEGNRVSSRLQTPDSYLLTSLTATAIAKRVLSGSAPPGFQTPSRAYGADFILEFEGVVRSDC